MQINHTRHGEAELTWCVCVCARACVGIQGVGSGKIQRKIFRGRAHRGSVGVFSEHKKDTSEHVLGEQSKRRTRGHLWDVESQSWRLFNEVVCPHGINSTASVYSAETENGGRHR
jgi:hypothetical protein